MVRTDKGFYGLLIAGFLSLTLMAGCGGGGGGSTSDDNTGGGTGSSLAGTWRNDETTHYNIYTFTDTTWDFTSGYLNGSGSCNANGTYSLNGNTVTETILYDDCDQAPVNSTYTWTYSISGNTLTQTNPEYNESRSYIKLGSYAISGRVADSSNIGISGVTVVLGGARYATTDSSGNYSLTELANGSWTVIPTKTGYTFNPASSDVTVNGADITGQDFVGSATGHTISGTVADSSNVGISGVNVTINGGSIAYSITTDSSGNYTLSGFANGSYTVIPSKTGYTFNPSSTAVTVSGANVTGQNFVGSIDGGGGGSTAATGRMPDTNQTTSYTSTFGEDHDYTINPPSYTDNGDGTVTDNVTGLTWQQQDDATTRTWEDAGAYCDESTLGGYSDWRLPSRLELISIVDYGVYNPSINSTYFPGTSYVPGTSSILYYWSSTTSAYGTSYAWSVEFSDGDFTGYGPKTYSNYVRCVRGGQTTPSLTDNGNGTVTDSETNLTWQQGESSEMTWEAALTYCEGLSLATQTDWRLPNVKELSSIVDDTRYSPTINTTFFPNAYSSGYWSSTTHASTTNDAWNVYFYSGGVLYSSKPMSSYVRCVRGGE